MRPDQLPSTWFSLPAKAVAGVWPIHMLLLRGATGESWVTDGNQCSQSYPKKVWSTKVDMVCFSSAGYIWCVADVLSLDLRWSRQPLLIKPVFGLLAHAEKTVFFKNSFPVSTLKGHGRPLLQRYYPSLKLTHITGQWLWYLSRSYSTVSTPSLIPGFRLTLLFLLFPIFLTLLLLVLLLYYNSYYFILFPTFFILQLQQVVQGYHAGIVSSHCKSSELKYLSLQTP